MKTAMQELLDELKEYQLEFNIPIEVIDMCESQLNVEKEQIMNAWIATDNQLQRLAAEQYYNQTYNQNK
jgi:Zn-dependent peptidase ImmA (M78 family)